MKWNILAKDRAKLLALLNTVNKFRKTRVNYPLAEGKLAFKETSATYLDLVLQRLTSSQYYLFIVGVICVLQRQRQTQERPLFSPPPHFTKHRMPDRQCTYHVTLRRVPSKCYILWVCICSLRYPACKVHVPYCHLWPVRLYNIFQLYLANGTIFGKQAT